MKEDIMKKISDKADMPDEEMETEDVTVEEEGTEEPMDEKEEEPTDGEDTVKMAYNTFISEAEGADAETVRVAAQKLIDSLGADMSMGEDIGGDLPASANTFLG